MNSLSGNIARFSVVSLSVFLLLISPVYFSCSLYDSENKVVSQDIKDENKGNNRGGSSGWKGWNVWNWEQPSFEELEDILTSEDRPWSFTLEFYSVWDERFQNYPNAPDGFIVFHIYSRYKVKEILIEVVPEDQVVQVLGGSSTQISEIPGESVVSYFVPIMAPDETGEFEINALSTDMSNGYQVKKKIFMIKKHRRDISGQTLDEYLHAKWIERLEQMPRRPGTDFYKPIHYGEPAVPISENEIGDPDPAMEGLYDKLMSIDSPPDGGPPFGDLIDLFLDVETVEAHSVDYTFHGKITHWDHFEDTELPLAGVGVWVLDYDENSAEDKICETVTRDDGTFTCTGSAEDPGGDLNDPPDPYLAVSPVNDQVRVMSCPQYPTKWFINVYVAEDNMWKQGNNTYGWENLPGGVYELTQPYAVSSELSSEMLKAQFFTFAVMNKSLNKNIDALNEAKIDPADPDINTLGFHWACCPSTCEARHHHYRCGTWDLDWCHRLSVSIGCATRHQCVGHEMGHSIHQVIWGMDRGLPDSNTMEHVWTEGLASALSNFAYNHPSSKGIPEDPDYHPGDEGSFVHFKYDMYGTGSTFASKLEFYYDEMTTWRDPENPKPYKDFPHGWMKGPHEHEVIERQWDGVQQALCYVYRCDDPNDPEYNQQKCMDYCSTFIPLGYEGRFVLDMNEEAQKGDNTIYTRAALWDFYDGWAGDDKKCEYHFWTAKRNACDTWYGYRDEKSWGVVMRAVSENPRNYFEFAEDLYSIIEQREGQNPSFDECETKNYIRTVSRFNHITLRDAFGETWHDWGVCDRWELSPEQPPPPCAATQAVVSAVEDGVEGVSITPEEGESLLERVRRIRDDYLLKSDLGLYYAYMYNSCSEEIIDIIMSNPQVTLAALELIEDAAVKIDNIENLQANGLPPVDDQFLGLALSIIDELQRHTSPDLLLYTSVVEEDLTIAHGMTVEELLDYFRYNP